MFSSRRAGWQGKEKVIKDLKIHVSDRTGSVSGLLILPQDARLLCVLAHGAGAGMRHHFMERLAAELASKRIGTLRYQFPYMEAGKKRPDVPGKAVAAVKRAVDAAAQYAPALPLIAGGKSFGGRMTSMAASSEPLPNVKGLVFF